MNILLLTSRVVFAGGQLNTLYAVARRLTEECMRHAAGDIEILCLLAFLGLVLSGNHHFRISAIEVVTPFCQRVRVRSKPVLSL